MAATSNSIISLRRHDLDNVRTFLTGLVTVHHATVAYGGAGSWPLKSALFNGGTSLALTSLNVLNQSFFMGLFFWISGRVSAQSLSKTLPWPFLKNKLIRLGLPAVVYTLTVAPAVRLTALPRWDATSMQTCLSNYWSRLNAVQGPLWYNATLLVFDAVAAAVVLMSAKKTRAEKQTSAPVPGAVPGVSIDGDHDDCGGSTRIPTYEKLSKLGWVAVAVASALVRLRYPVGRCLPIIALQPAFGCQYVFAYGLGYLSYVWEVPRMVGPFDQLVMARAAEVKEKPSTPPPTSFRIFSRISLPTAFALAVSSMALIILPRYMDTPDDWRGSVFRQVWGGWNLPALIYAFWNEFAFVTLGPAIMDYFERRHNRPLSSTSVWNARYSYAAFLVHTPLLVAGQIGTETLLSPWESAASWVNKPLWQFVGPLVLTLGVGVGSSWASFWLGKKLLEWVPSLKKII
ncbi:Acyltransferase 3 [Apiospora rasikravindrae]|uniref:Acyltransferase 3 n=1 Tax=Apiospora rasikravindrae TaxID=990691 RepID=A0ABR1SJP8_9PEZI